MGGLGSGEQAFNCKWQGCLLFPRTNLVHNLMLHGFPFSLTFPRDPEENLKRLKAAAPQYVPHIASRF